MKKLLLCCLVGLSMLLVKPLYAGSTDKLLPVGNSIENRLVYEPIEVVYLDFSVAIAISDGAKATITCDGERMAEGVITMGDARGQRQAAILFDKTILPKGKSYKLKVPAEAIYTRDQPTIVMDRYVTPFTVPEYIITRECSIQEGDTIGYTKSISFYYDTETEPLGTPMATLYREGVPIQSVAVYITWDWDLGQMHANFEKYVDFEEGVHYTFTLPEGSMSPRFRTDITNAESSVHFIGGAATPPAEVPDPIPPLEFVKCSLFDQTTPPEVLNEVYFYYDEPIKLSDDPKIQLFDCSDKSLIKEVIPTLTHEDDWWIVACDFGGVRLPEDGSLLIITEGSVLRAGDNQGQNGKITIQVTPTPQSTDQVEANKPSIYGHNGQIIINNAPMGELVSVYAVDGGLIAREVISAHSFVLSVKPNAVYVVSLLGRTYRVIL
ncbi:MAG: DUF6383 domain-containing protein [Porphyromonas sp.]|uniref:DUF6383 domain-containing protein n=1 Tax=Porphyromonas sp. TaxID=1924944 RepID=UPI002A74F6CD|nr:DUF6383 domain-containing protein [Porphyromonas sp.]MDY3112506.1 DUF6383 domain-containing protein [Porphyromonas sp.]MDY4246175.1 DUF6383 domain-containing protein [Porphyromonas sp.]